MLGLATGQQRAERSLSANVTRRPDAVHDDASLQLDLLVVSVHAAERRQHRGGLVVSVAREEPPRRLWQPVHTDPDHEAEDDLKSNGKAPGQVWASITRTEIDPVGDEGTKGDDASFDADQQPSVGGARTFGLISRDGRGVDSIADAGDDPSDDELRRRPMTGHGADLDDDAQDHSGGAEHDGTPPTDLVAKEELKDCAKQATDFVDGGDEALPCAVVFGLGKGSVERDGADDATHDPLIVAKQQEAGRRDDADRQGEFPAGEAHVVRHSMLVVVGP